MFITKGAHRHKSIWKIFSMKTNISNTKCLKRVTRCNSCDPCFGFYTCSIFFITIHSIIYINGYKSKSLYFKCLVKSIKVFRYKPIILAKELIYYHMLQILKIVYLKHKVHGAWYHYWQDIIQNFNVFRKSRKHSANRRCVEELQREYKGGR